MTLGQTIVPAASISSLMVGVITKDDGSSTVSVKHCQSSTSLSSSSSSTTGEVESQTDHGIREFQRMIRQAWLENPKVVTGGGATSTTSTTTCGAMDDTQEPSANQLFEKLQSDEAQLGRILVARKYEMDACVNLFFEQFRFRAKWKPQSIQAEDIPNALPSGAWRLAGYSKEGHVVSNYKLRYWEPGNLGSKQKSDGKDGIDDAVEEYTKFVVYMIELMIAKMKASPAPQKFVVLFDLKGFTPSLVFRKDVRLMIRKLIYVAQSQYPERLHKTLLINAPFGFESAWRLIQPLLDEKTAAKIRFANVTSLTEDIDIDVLSKEYGGHHEEYPIPCGTRE